MRGVGLAFLVLISFWGCAEQSQPEFSSCEDHAAYVYAKEEAFVASDYSPELARELMRSYADFANSCNRDTLAPEFLMRRADMLRGEGKIVQSISAFTAIHDGYPEYSNKILCAMIAAYLYETEMNDKEMAEKIYKEVVNSYPDSKEAEMAKISLLYLRETPEELSRRLKLNEAK